MLDFENSIQGCFGASLVVQLTYAMHDVRTLRIIHSHDMRIYTDGTYSVCTCRSYIGHMSLCKCNKKHQGQNLKKRYLVPSY